jgi:hypothetical protein
MRHWLFSASAASFLILSNGQSARAQQADLLERFRARSAQAEADGLAEPFKGVTTNGVVIPDLFPIRSTGVPTEPIRIAADELLATLTPDQRSKTVFAVDDAEWRKWMNQHFYVRQGVGFNEMSDRQREAAIRLLRSSLSAKPSPTEPWGWQLDGHHLIINYFVLGDQVVMTPFFLGSEPVIAESGKFKGVEIMQKEQDQGLALLLSLSPGQRARAVLEVSKDGNNTLGEAFKDNIVLDYAGVPASSFSLPQKQRLLELIDLYVANMDDGHARVKMEEVEAHLGETYFAWIGGDSDEAVFYYRIHSPVILIEFDHQRPVGMRHLLSSGPNRQHIHSVVRTPNGNDYGKDLLRQHYQQHSHRE